MIDWFDWVKSCSHPENHSTRQHSLPTTPEKSGDDSLQVMIEYLPWPAYDEPEPSYFQYD